MQYGVAKMSPRFSDRILQLLERVEHRCAETRTEKEAVARIRNEADFRQRLVEPRANGRLHDKGLDDAPNAWVTMTFIDGELASTLRLHVAADEKDALPSLGAFSDVITPHLRSGQAIVELTRLAAQVEFARRYPELPYVALRPAWLAAEHFDADFLLMTVIEQRQAFYRYALGYRPWCAPRDYVEFSHKVVCMGLDFGAARERIEARYPFFRSTPSERNALFGRLAERRRHLPGHSDARLHTPRASG